MYTHTAQYSTVDCSALATENCLTAKPQSDYQVWISLSTITFLSLRVILLALYILESLGPNWKRTINWFLANSHWTSGGRGVYLSMGLPTNQETYVHSQSNCWSGSAFWKCISYSRYMYMYILRFFKNAIAVIFDRYILVIDSDGFSHA